MVNKLNIEVGDAKIVARVSMWSETVLQDNPLLAARIAALPGMPGAESEGMEEVIRFLWLCVRSSESITPSKRVDAIWHEFLLFTRSYETFCKQRLGDFVHHQPSANPPVELMQYQNTIEKYRRTFGEPNTAFWPVSNAVAECGPCEST